jgi:hypothetical protein
LSGYVSTISRPTATLVLPCLNEGRTLSAVLDEARAAIAADARFTWRVVVADNGSTDDSVDVALHSGAQVVHVPVRGYGAALDAGIRAATTEWVAFHDADGTYRPDDAVLLVHLAHDEGADLAVGNRFLGPLEKGAMPWLHRHVGTPVLSWLLRRLHRSAIGDCNSGVRVVRRSAYLGWAPRSSGMEFASELLVRAAQAGAKTVEAPATLRPSPKGRVPHLRTWRDGMRHLLVLLALAPGLFWHPGVLLLATSLALSLPAALRGLTTLPSGIELFGPHTQAVGILLGWLGAILFHLGLVAMSGRPASRQPRLARRLTEMPEDVLFWLLVLLGGGLVGGVARVAWVWSSVHFSHLDFLRFTLALVYFTTIPGTVLVGLFHAHLQRRVAPR